MAQVTIDTEGIPEDDGTFTVSWTATSSIGMPTEIFVFKFTTQTFSHVANAADLQYPTDPDETKGFYRQSAATDNFASIPSAENAKTNIANAIQTLVDTFNDDLAGFDITTTTTYT